MFKCLLIKIINYRHTTKSNIEYRILNHFGKAYILQQMAVRHSNVLTTVICINDPRKRLKALTNKTSIIYLIMIMNTSRWFPYNVVQYVLSLWCAYVVLMILKQQMYNVRKCAVLNQHLHQTE